MSRYEDDRTYYERDRDGGRERDRFVEDDRSFMRGGRGRDGPDDRFDRRPPPRAYDDDFVRDRRYHDDDFRYERRGPPSGGPDIDRRIVIDREREREYYRSPSPRRPPVLVRRQSSLDSYDRRPLRGFHEREEYPPPARREDIRREDYRAPPYTPIPLPRQEPLPPPSRRTDRDYYDDERVVERDYYIDEGRHLPERVHEREIIRERDRRDEDLGGARTHRSRSVSSRSSSSSRSRTVTVRSEYPKKGKTRIPARLVSKRAIVDLQYPFVEEGATIIIQKALGQDHIDELLKISEEYIKAELEFKNGGPGPLEEIVNVPPPPPPPPVSNFMPPPPAPVQMSPQPPPMHAPAPAPVIVDAGPPSGSIEITDRTVIRESSPPHHHHHHDAMVVGPVIERARSRSRSGRDIRAEIRALERELTHRPKVEVDDYDVVRTQRLEDGQVVVYEERVERTSSGHKPPRIEKDKKGPPPGLLRAMLTTLT